MVCHRAGDEIGDWIQFESEDGEWMSKDCLTTFPARVVCGFPGSERLFCQERENEHVGLVGRKMGKYKYIYDSFPRSQWLLG